MSLRSAVSRLLDLAFAHGPFLLASAGRAAQHKGLLAAVGCLTQLDLHAVDDARPVRLIEQFALKTFEHGLGRAHQVGSLPLAQLIENLLADHPAIHDPHPPLVTVLGA